ncbi:MAG TPA: AtpZ/AtpI family protein [Pyrinomonadaceae bacterium]|jgi:ATP synthase protein I|nr:AtpZ/AtpI family protein [Pyrinomonadaceae bacterium]
MGERDDEEQSVNQKSSIAYAAALSLFFSVATLLGLGLLLDRWLGTTPWLLVAGIVLGSVVGLYQFVRMTSRID